MSDCGIEALAVFMLRLTDEFANAGKLQESKTAKDAVANDLDLVRTRDPAKCKSITETIGKQGRQSMLTYSVEPLDIVVDVGGVYSPEKHRYDHHQRGFTEVFGAGGFDKTKLSSAGLVYKCVSVPT